jgi:hypothetical protein
MSRRAFARAAVLLALAAFFLLLDLVRVAWHGRLGEPPPRRVERRIGEAPPPRLPIQWRIQEVIRVGCGGAVTTSVYRSFLVKEPQGWVTPYQLVGVDLTGAPLQGVDLSFKRFSRVCFTGANLADAQLHGARLWDCNLHRANLQRADLGEPELRGVNLADARLFAVNLRAARYDHSTRWPAGFRPEEWGARLEEGSR